MRFWMSLLGGTVVLAAVAVVALLVASGDDDAKGTNTAGVPAAQRASGPMPDFELKFPSAWRRLAAEEAKGRGEGPRLVIARKDKAGMLSMAIRGPIRQSLASLKADLEARLKKQFPQMRSFESQRVTVPAGPGLHTTFVDGRTGRVQTNLVIPAGKLSYVLDAVVRGDSRAAAREVGLMFSAFDGEKAR